MIQLMDLDAVLGRLADDPTESIDVAALALQLARDEYPALNVPAYLAALDELADEVRPALSGGPKSRLARFCRVLFERHGFRGDEAHYYAADNSYLNRVLDRRKGIPLTLSLLAMAVGARAGLEIVGVGLPGHFIAKYRCGQRELLFDPYHGGRALDPDDCEQLVRRVTGEVYELTEADLADTPTGLIVRRLLTNLKGSYLRDEEFARAARVIRRLLQLDPDNPLEKRDLGVCLMRSGRPGAAIDMLEAYLDAHPTAVDGQQVRQLLGLARREVARWN